MANHHEAAQEAAAGVASAVSGVSATVGVLAILDIVKTGLGILAAIVAITSGLYAIRYYRKKHNE